MFGSSVSKRSLNTYKINAYSLYAKPCRGGSAWISGILVANNTAACIFCFTVLGLNRDFASENDDYPEYDNYDTSSWKAAAAFDIIILLGLFISSIVNALHRYHRTISAKRIVITSSLSIAALIIWALVGLFAGNGDSTFAIGIIVCGPSGIFFYGLAIIFGAVALRRERKGWKGASKSYVEELNDRRREELTKDADAQPIELGSAQRV